MPIQKYRVETDKGTFEVEVEEPETEKSPSLPSRVWGAANTPLIDQLQTPTLARARASFAKEHPTWSGIGETAASLTSPVSLGLAVMEAGAPLAAKAGYPLAAKMLRVPSKLAAAGQAAHGLSNVVAGKDMPTRLGGAVETGLGLGAAGAPGAIARKAGPPLLRIGEGTSPFYGRMVASGLGAAMGESIPGGGPVGAVVGGAAGLAAPEILKKTGRGLIRFGQRNDPLKAFKEPLTQAQIRELRHAATAETRAADIVGKEHVVAEDNMRQELSDATQALDRQKFRDETAGLTPTTKLSESRGMKTPEGPTLHRTTTFRKPGGEYTPEELALLERATATGRVTTPGGAVDQLAPRVNMGPTRPPIRVEGNPADLLRNSQSSRGVIEIKGLGVFSGNDLDTLGGFVATHPEATMQDLKEFLATQAGSRQGFYKTGGEANLARKLADPTE